MQICVRERAAPFGESGTSAGGCFIRLKKKPNANDQQRGSDTDRGDLEVGGSTICGEHEWVHDAVYFRVAVVL